MFGIGLGFTMMPVFTGAMQSIRGPAVARASTALNILQQTGASIGTAVLSVLLASAITSKLGRRPRHDRRDTGGLRRALARILAPPMAAAFGQTFWWALALLVVAFIGSLALPKRKPELAGDEQLLPLPI